MDKPLPLSSLRTILWAGLVHENKDLTPEEVGGWVDQENFGEVMRCFFSLFGKISLQPDQVPPDQDGKEAAPEKETVPLASPISSVSPTEPLPLDPVNSGT